MNLYPHPRHLLVPRHARRSLVSSRPECSVTYSFSYADRFCATLRRSNRTSKRQIIPITAACLNLCTRSAPFKVHSLPSGRLPSSRCIRSARPRIMRLPTIPRWALQINQLFNDVFSDIDSPDRSSLTSFSFAPRTDVYEEDDRIVLEMEVPGMREEDVHLTLEGNTLSISGERKIEKNRKPDRYQRIERYYGSFSRTFTLPATVDPDSVDAKYEHGILHVSMAKKANARPRQIKVNGGAKQL